MDEIYNREFASFTKEFANSEGDAIFASFMKEMSKVPDSNEHKAEIIKRANEKCYHDYEGGDYPKLLLVTDLHKAGLFDLCQRASQGEFDF